MVLKKQKTLSEIPSLSAKKVPIKGPFIFTIPRRGARAVEWDGLENR